MRITDLKSHEILDSKGDPTLEVSIALEDGTTAISQVPSGASTGSTEAFELRDNDASRYFGKGVLNAVSKVNNELKNLLIGQEAYNQVEIDNMMIQADGTVNKSNLGGNSIVGVSMAVCRVAALSQKKELYQYFGELSGFNKFQMPMPSILVMEGGKHGNWATDIQEFMITPNHQKFPTFREKLRAGETVFQILGKILIDKGYDGGVGFEGAYAPRQLQSNQEALELIVHAIERAGYQPGTDMTLAIDAAASEFFEVNHYILKSENNRQIATEEWMDQLIAWTKKFPLTILEDPLDETEWDAWQNLTQQLGATIQIVGDDLVTTNVTRIQQAIDLKAMNATLIKLNQVGTVSETLNAINLSASAGFGSMVSHRGGETNDDMIADLAVGTASGQCKFGGPDRGERLAKYNRLLRIENQFMGL